MRFFNEIRKYQYIKEKSEKVIISDYYLETRFKQTEKYENELKKDISEFTYNEIIDFYKRLNATSLDSLVVMNSHFSMYTDWCIQKGLIKDHKNYFTELKREILKECLNKDLTKKKIVTREIILNWVNELPNPKDQFILLGLFEGLKGKNFCELSKAKQNDINGNVAMLYTGRKIKVSKQLLKIIDDCITEDTYYSITGHGTKTMPLVDRGYIVKDYPNARIDVSDFQVGRKIYTGITRILNYFDVSDYMTANSVADSGKIHMIKERSKELGISAKEFLKNENYIKEIEMQYGVRISKSLFCMKYKEYL
ncbi:MAG: hypothetical protein ACLSX5_01620 [Lachnospiraceae bacterium]